MYYRYTLTTQGRNGAQTKGIITSSRFRKQRYFNSAINRTNGCISRTQFSTHLCSYFPLTGFRAKGYYKKNHYEEVKWLSKRIVDVYGKQTKKFRGLCSIDTWYDSADAAPVDVKIEANKYGRISWVYNETSGIHD